MLFFFYMEFECGILGFFANQTYSLNTVKDVFSNHLLLSNMMCCTVMFLIGCDVNEN